ncbi:MAG TPA: FAD synthase [Methanosarcinaceae archaeon]|nr:FAD synthase [Methanosarcinaceae archaeon]
MITNTGLCVPSHIKYHITGQHPNLSNVIKGCCVSTSIILYYKGDFLTRVLATGTFDLLHPGHVLYLGEARALGDNLYVIVARDSMINHKPKPITPEDQRLTMVNALEIVDRAILGSETDMFEPLKKIKPDIVAIGYDQTYDIKELETNLKEHGFDAKVVRINISKTCELCSSGKIIKKVIERYS